MAASVTREQHSNRLHYTHVTFPGLDDDVRAPARLRDGPEHGWARRAWWLRQARFALRRARGWRQRFGGPMHAAVLGWYLEELLEAERYRTWARERARHG